MTHPVTVDVRSRFPLAYQDVDDSLGQPLLRWLSLLWDQAGEVADLADRIDAEVGALSGLVDPDSASDGWLRWLGQILGFQFPASMPPVAMRAALRTATFQRGTAATMTAVAKRYLKPGATVTIVPSGVTSTAGAVTNPALLTPAVTAASEAALTTASFSHTTGGLIVVLASLFTPSSAGATTFAISDTMGGLTWTQVSANKGTTGNETVASIFYARSNGTAGTVTVTPSRTGATTSGMTLTVYGVTGQAGVGVTGTSTGSGTVTLAATPATSSLVVSLFVDGNGSDPSTTIPAGTTALFTDRKTGADTYDTAVYRNGSAPQARTFGGSATNAAAVAVEITAAPVTSGDEWHVGVRIYSKQVIGATYAEMRQAYPTYTALKAAFATYAGYISQTANLLAALNAEKPAGLVMTVTFTGATYTDMRSGWGTYSAVKTAFSTYTASKAYSP